ncbi:MAG TPA: hypothetical protein VEC12_12185, partial [Bacteroidia bacterium]|nr:hypothetical protein [Bacteroidia bacterium]
MGSDITYRCLSASKYEITITVYRDCNGIPLGTVQVYTTTCNTSSWSRTDTLTEVSVRDITGINPACTTQSRCNGSYIYGFEEHVLKDTIDLSGLSCTEFSISWQESARNSTITTGAADYNFYTEAILYNYPNVCNNSPIYTTPPAALLCVGANFQFNNGALDTLDGDSLSFKLVDPLQAKGTIIPYNSPFSATKPLTFLGFPNQNLASPAGFRFDSTTGNLDFRATMTNQVTVIVQEVTEWRKVNDTMRVVGKTRRDMQFIVINCGGNRNPVISSSSIATCPNEQVCISITTSDQDGDSVKLSWNNGIPNATYTGSNGTVLMDTAQICWTPTEDNITNIPYNFT